MPLDGMPVWVSLLATVAVVLVALEVGVRLGKRRLLRGAGKSEVSGAMVAATMGLLAFMLAFTFNGAAGRHDVRKSLVIDEANAIDKAWLRAGFLADPYRSAARGTLRHYVDVRVRAIAGTLDTREAVRHSETLLDSLWAVAEEAGSRDAGSITTGLFIQAVNEVIDLHLKRVTFGLRYRVPAPIWAALYLLMCAGMVMMGSLVGLSGTRHRTMELALALAFAVVLFVIADLDRPQEGLINVSQQAMHDLQVRLSAR